MEADSAVLHVAHEDDEDEGEGLGSALGEAFISDSTLHVCVGFTVFAQFTLLVVKLALRGALNDKNHESHDTMHAVDTIMYSVAVIRNACLIYYLRTQVPEHRIHSEHFRLGSLAREAVFGPTAEMLLELVLGVVIGVSLEVVAFELTFSDMGTAYWNYTAQCINFSVLFALILVTERAWAGVHILCRWQQGIQIMLIVYDIVLHTITMSKPGMNHDFRDLRMASLASLIAVRLVMFRFFSFKSHNPTLSYVNPLHAKLPVPDGATLVKPCDP